MIDLRHLRYFMAVAELRHFGRAAERLHLTQPPLSRAIAGLEADLGVQLFERRPRDLALTPAGEQLLRDSRLVLDTVETARRNARLAALGESGEVVLGFMMHATHTVVPDLVRRFTARYPHIQLGLRETVPNRLVEALNAGRIDAGILFPVARVAGLETRRLFRDRLCAVVPHDHELAARPMIGREDLRDAPLIVTPVETAPALRNAVAHYCGEAGFLPRVAMEVQLQQTIVSLVAEGLGVGLVPESMQKLPMPGVVYRPLDDAPVIDHIIAWKTDNPNLALKRFLEVAGESADWA
ncbi:MAG: LysR substrate-binding domain-containing protein [Asticcacaulis sp.]|uniref:LysR substrate-binding domain-containing protein n=1 Tax=Asticcacaulis sp. TaxID=1872648 RepID=UPI0039E3D9D1